MQLPKNFLWVALACLFVIVMYTIVNQGGFLKQLSVNPDGVTIKFDQLKDVPSQELAERQSRLEQKITDINNTLSQTSRQSSAAANDAGAVSAPIAVNLTGRWSSDVGLFYLINQYDNVLVHTGVQPDVRHHGRRAGADHRTAHQNHLSDRAEHPGKRRS